MVKMKMSGEYIVLVIFDLIALVLLLDSLSVAFIDLYALLMGSFFEIPLALILGILSYLVWRNPRQRSLGEQKVFVLSVAVAICLLVVPFLLFAYGMIEQGRWL